MTPEEHAEVVQSAVSKLSENLAESLEFEKERAQKNDRETEGRIWLALYCSYIKSPNPPQYPAYVTDKALEEYKQRFGQ